MTQSVAGDSENPGQAKKAGRILINFDQAKQLLEFFGGLDSEVVAAECAEGHAGPGLYIWCEDHPEEGASFLGLGGFACENAPAYNNIERVG
ncbi:hypothetical protein WS72_19205 [Burkholderia savannae]|uniref:Uncharacterized protein n=1 Tax=Burkholderia savannae TaxID=1637837 RepID=A0ABR5T8B9_9BURK|nr:hypothetical protein [Burkholderia savannae]KWZ39541.1 hypothetical protein WS72_19205 [Burkholderia savannae]